MEENKEEQKENTNLDSQKKMNPLALAGLGLVSTLVLAAIIGVGVVSMQVKAVSHNPTILKFAKILNFPVVTVNGQKVPYVDYIDDINTLNHFYEVQKDQLPPVTQTELSDMTLSRLVAYKIIEDLAKDYNITVSDEDVAAKKQELLASFPDQAAAEAELQKTYAWSLDTYLKKVIVPVLREQKLQKAFEESTDSALNDYILNEYNFRHIVLQVDDPKNDEKIKKQAQALLDRVNKGEDFEKIAKENNTDDSKEASGDLGWIRKGDFPSEFETPAFALEKGKHTELVKTSYGYHIIRLEESRSIKDFTAFMDKKISSADIKIRINVNNPFTEIQARLNGTASTSTDTAAIDVAPEVATPEATTSVQ
jgi:foldase protein PrsA